MVNPYSHKHFFRKIPPSQLAQYFASKEVDLGIDFSKFDIKQIDSLFDAYIALPENQQTAFEAEFQNIHAMACDGGIQALIDESLFHEDENFVTDISAIDGLHAKVMWAFLEKYSYWHGATLFLHADNVSSSYWKKRNDLPHVTANVKDDDINTLAYAISNYFYKAEGRGRNCKVEVYRRHNKEYFFAYPEDFALSTVEWIDKNLKSRARHPAFEVIFVYCENEGSLDIYAPKNTKAIPELQKIFAKVILHLETLPDGTVDNRVYDLNPLANREFVFQTEPGSGIEQVVVTQLRLTLKFGAKRRITLEADTKQNTLAVYDLLKDIKPPDYYITQATIKVIFESITGIRARPRTFNISFPNSCALDNDGVDLKIRKMLVKSGIEPKR